MTSRKSDIEGLLKRSNDTLQKILPEYEASLKSKKIGQDLRIDVKQCLDLLRSILDYLAHDIRETYCPSADPKGRFYFPILPDSSKFATRMNQWYPGLQTSNGDVWNFLETNQPYKRGKEWLGQFNKVNNENKHDKLVEQTKTESTGGSRITTPGVGSITWNKGVTFSKGISLMGAPVDPATQMPIPRSGQKVERIIWVDFKFEETGVSVLPLLRSAQKGVDAIVGGAYAFPEMK